VGLKQEVKNYRITVDMPPNSKIRSSIPLTSNVTLRNLTRQEEAIYLHLFDSERKEIKKFVNVSAIIKAGSTFDVQNKHREAQTIVFLLSR